jgi:hypothetical protein
MLKCFPYRVNNPKYILFKHKIKNNRQTNFYLYRCPENGALPMHCGVEEITINVRKMLKKILLDLFADLAVFESGT